LVFAPRSLFNPLILQPFAGVAGGSATGTPGWTVHLLQPSDPNNPDSLGFAPIPREGKGTSQGDLVPRPPLEAGKTAEEYLSILQKAKEDKDSPYHHESGLTPEDWVMAFILHLQETGEPLDNAWNSTNRESSSNLIGAFFHSSVPVPYARWDRDGCQAFLGRNDPLRRAGYFGARSSVMI